MKTEKEKEFKELMRIFNSHIELNKDFEGAVKNIIIFMNLNKHFTDIDKYQVLVQLYDKIDDNQKNTFIDIVEKAESISNYVKIKFYSYYKSKTISSNEKVEAEEIKEEPKQEAAKEETIDFPQAIEEIPIDEILVDEAEDAEIEDSFLQKIIDDVKKNDLCEFILDDNIVIHHFTFNAEQKAKALIDVYNNLDEERANNLVTLIDKDDELDIEIKTIFANYIVELTEEYKKADKATEELKKLEAFLDDVANSEKAKSSFEVREKTIQAFLLTDKESRVEALIDVYNQLDEKKQEQFMEMINKHEGLDSEIKQIVAYRIKDGIEVRTSDKFYNYLLNKGVTFQYRDIFDKDIDKTLGMIASGEVVTINSSGIITDYMPLNDDQRVSVLNKIYNYIEPDQQEVFKEKVKANAKLNKLPLAFAMVEVSNDAVSKSAPLVSKPVAELAAETAEEEDKPIEFFEIDPSDSAYDEFPMMRDKEATPVVDLTNTGNDVPVNKPRGTKVVKKKKSNWAKEHKKLLIGIGLGVLAAGLYLNPATHMMINSALWGLGSKLGWSSLFLEKLHLTNLALASTLKGGAYSFVHTGYYTLGGKIGAEVLYTVGKAKLVGMLTALAGAGSIGLIVSSIIDKIKNKNREKEYEEEYTSVDNQTPEDKDKIIEDLEREIEYLKRIIPEKEYEMVRGL